MTRPCAFLLVLTLLPCGAAGAGEEGLRPHLSDDPEVGRARALIRDGLHEAALSVLRPLASAGRPDRIDILFLTGLAAVRAAGHPERTAEDRDALLDESVAALHAILVMRPGLVRVRMELARAFFLKGEDGLARAHFERVLAGGISPAAAANVRRFLDGIRARRRWSAQFGIALASDSNINAVSDDGVIYIYGLPFQLAPDAAGPKPGLGAAVWGGADYRRPVDGRLRLRLGGDFSRREYGNDTYDRTSLSVHAGPHWLTGADTELALLASLRWHLAAGATHSREYGLRFELDHRLSHRLSAQVRTSWHRRTHAGGGSLDGTQLAVSLGAAWLATPQLRLDALLGRVRGRTRSERSRSTQRRARLGVTAALPRGFTLGGWTEWRRREFDGPWGVFTPGGVPRRDRTRTLSVSLFHRAFTISGFSPRLSLVRETRHSNAQLHDYRRTHIEFSAVRQY